MTAPALLETLTKRGAVIEAHGDRLAIDAPRDVLTDDPLEELRALKPDLLELLAASTSAPAHRWKEAAQESAPSPAPSDEPLDERTLALRILLGAYPTGDGKTRESWRLCWSRRSREAWRAVALSLGGTLDELHGVPSIDAPTCIEWALRVLDDAGEGEIKGVSNLLYPVFCGMSVSQTQKHER